MLGRGFGAKAPPRPYTPPLTTVEVTLRSLQADDLIKERKLLLRPNTRIPIGRVSKNASKGILASARNAFINSPVVSREHAVMSCDDGNVIHITDLQSMHGTWINNTSLEPHRPCALQNGDTLQIGGHVVRDTENIAPKRYAYAARLLPAVGPVRSFPRAISVSSDGSAASQDDDELDRTDDSPQPRRPTAYGSQTNPVDLDDFDFGPESDFEMEEEPYAFRGHSREASPASSTDESSQSAPLSMPSKEVQSKSLVATERIRRGSEVPDPPSAVQSTLARGSSPILGHVPAASITFTLENNVDDEQEYGPGWSERSSSPESGLEESGLESNHGESDESESGQSDSEGEEDAATDADAVRRSKMEAMLNRVVPTPSASQGPSVDKHVQSQTAAGSFPAGTSDTFRAIPSSPPATGPFPELFNAETLSQTMPGLFTLGVDNVNANFRSEPSLPPWLPAPVHRPSYAVRPTPHIPPQYYVPARHQAPRAYHESMPFAEKFSDPDEIPRRSYYDEWGFSSTVSPPTSNYEKRMPIAPPQAKRKNLSIAEIVEDARQAPPNPSSLASSFSLKRNADHLDEGVDDCVSGPTVSRFGFGLEHKAVLLDEGEDDRVSDPGVTEEAMTGEIDRAHPICEELNQMAKPLADPIPEAITEMPKPLADPIPEAITEMVADWTPYVALETAAAAAVDTLPPRKRVKVAETQRPRKKIGRVFRFASTVAAGAAMGAVAVIGTLTALPEGFFE